MRLRHIPHADETIAAHALVIEEAKKHKGHWKDVFGNDHPIAIEIGMGKGQFIVEQAKRHPEYNFIGIERYSSVLLRATEKVDEQVCEEVPNLRFICMDATEIEEVFEPGEVAKLYLNFSDPWPKARHARRRLTSIEFLRRYENILQKEGNLEFKTDNRGLFEFSLEQVEEANWKLLDHTFDLHHHEWMNEGNVMTEYEEKFSSKGQPIHKLIATQQTDK
jgi:tRNA (guanine-N7-)-methyltransferase